MAALIKTWKHLILSKDSPESRCFGEKIKYKCVTDRGQLQPSFDSCIIVMNKLLLVCLVVFSCAYLSYALEERPKLRLGVDILPIDHPVVKAIKHFATHTYNEQSNDGRIYVVKKVFEARKIVLPGDHYSLDVAFAPTNCLQNERKKKKLCIIEPNGKETKVTINLSLKANKEVENIDFE
uniref:Cystatin domain-containing protein n=1 Tax=Panagrellus redivivus TaxID=6233 RepID=A0A7E4UNX6_PANRE